MKDLIQKRSNLLQKLSALGKCLRGSVTHVCSTCNRANCICERKSSRRSYRLTFKDSNQKTNTLYIPHGKLGEVRKMVANYKRMRKTTEQLIEINVEIFRKDARDQGA